MPDLLLELFSEEIPARMQRQAADDLRRLVTDGLVEAGLTYEGAKAFATPRRLALTVHGVTARSADQREERRGPRVGAPAQAIEGFLRGAGLASIEDAQVRSDPKKGDFYVAVVSMPGRPAEAVVTELVPGVVRDFPWPKSMRWGARSAPPDSPFSEADAQGPASLRWVRPLRSILCTFGPETEAPIVPPIEVAGIAAGDATYGHRFMAGPEPIRVRRFDDYVPALEAGKVVLDPERRKAIIETEAKNLAFAQGLELVEDAGLLEEAAGLVEWPVVLMGRFDAAFLQIPDEVIRLTIRQNQKCFVLRQAAAVPPPSQTGEGDHAQHGGGGESSSAGGRHSPPPPPCPKSGVPDFGLHDEQPGNIRVAAVPLPRFAGEEPSAPARLTNRFVLVANIEASDGGAAIVAGNERVIAARLSDARFFWEQDKAVPLETWAEKLASVTFHEKLGSQAERVERIARLARELAPIVGADPDDAERAARLAKADLVTGMVGEFPELQGVMGRYYFLAQHGLSPTTGDTLSTLSSRFGRQAETGTHKHGLPTDSSGAPSEESGVYGSRTGADAPSGMTKGEEGAWGEEARLRAIADAIHDHYRPQGPNDSVPSAPVSVAVALADKLDTLVGFWAIDEKPTGSKDPFALRRAALGVIGLVLATSVRVHLADYLHRHYVAFPDRQKVHFPSQVEVSWGSRREFEVTISLLAFFADRLKVHLREEGARHDLIDAVFALPGQDDLVMIVRRVEALGKFLDTEDGANLLVGYRRAANILRAEEKRDGAGAFDTPPDAELIAARGQAEERALFEQMQVAEREARAAVEREDFAAAMTALASLRPAVDAFFDKVTVNADDPTLRANRLKLLNMLRHATLAVADFSRIGG